LALYFDFILQTLVTYLNSLFFLLGRSLAGFLVSLSIGLFASGRSAHRACTVMLGLLLGSLPLLIGNLPHNWAYIGLALGTLTGGPFFVYCLQSTSMGCIGELRRMLKW
jgi:hypothetical protein